MNRGSRRGAKTLLSPHLARITEEPRAEEEEEEIILITKERGMLPQLTMLISVEIPTIDLIR